MAVARRKTRVRWSEANSTRSAAKGGFGAVRLAFVVAPALLAFGPGVRLPRSNGREAELTRAVGGAQRAAEGWVALARGS